MADGGGKGDPLAPHPYVPSGSKSYIQKRPPPIPPREEIGEYHSPILQRVPTSPHLPHPTTPTASNPSPTRLTALTSSTGGGGGKSSGDSAFSLTSSFASYTYSLLMGADPTVQTMGSPPLTTSTPSPSPIGSPIKVSTPPAPKLAQTWKRDSDAKECQECKEPFTLVLRRHHCRVCGDIFCWSCSAKSLRHKDKKVRVCNGCFRIAKESKERGGMGVTSGMQRNLKQWEQAWRLPYPPEGAASMLSPKTTTGAPKTLNNNNSHNTPPPVPPKPKKAKAEESGEKERVEEYSGEQPQRRRKHTAPETMEDYFVYDEDEEDYAEGGKEKGKEKEKQQQQQVNSEKSAEELKAMKEKDDRTRSHIIRELMETEERYVTYLEAIVRDIIFPLKRTSLTDKEIVGVFLNVEEIVECHRPFKELIRERAESWTDQSCIADIFLLHIKSFWCYSGYYRNYNLKRVGLLLQRPDFVVIKEAFEQKQAKTSCLPLEAFLILPVQRIPRYVLFLTDLCKCTSDPMHPDYARLRLANDKLKELLDSLNKSIDPAKMDWLTQKI